MKKILLTIAIMLLNITLLQAAPSRAVLQTYTQADGSTFQASVKGDASFHWLQSNGEVIVYNPQDKNYYNTVLNKEGKFVRTNQKVGAYTSQSRNAKKILSRDKVAALIRLQKVARKGSHPR